MPEFKNPFRQPFQFSLRGLLIGMTVAALLLGLTAAFGAAVPQIATILIFVVLPTPLVVAIIYARGEFRTFAIGAIMPWVAMIGDGPPTQAGWDDFAGIAIWLFLFGGICGAVAVGSRRWIERNGFGGGK